MPKIQRNTSKIKFHLEIIRFETLYTWRADKKWETKEMHCISGNDFYTTKKKKNLCTLFIKDECIYILYIPKHLIRTNKMFKLISLYRVPWKKNRLLTYNNS